MNRIIQTERMILRPINKNDAKDIFEWVSDPVVNKYMPYSLYENIGQVEEWIESLVEEENNFVFELKDIRKVIGSGSITFEQSRNAYELGYNLNRNYWGNG